MSILNPFLNKISQFIKPKILIKSNYRSLILSNINYQTHLSKPIEFNVLSQKEEKAITEDVLKKVNEDQINSPSRVFAIVQICGKQFKITTDDMIVIEGYWPPQAGDKLRLDKVLCAGGVNFSLIGTPLIQPGLVNVYATVIEKSLSHTKTNFRKKRRKQYMRINFHREERTMLRINEIEIQELKEKIN